MAPVLSPMMAHGKYLKEQAPERKVVFVGPCAAKKEEATRAGYIDAVLTFTEIQELIKSEGNEVEVKQDITPELATEKGAFFPASGGFYKTAGLKVTEIDNKFLTVTGIEKLQELFSSFEKVQNLELIEAMACEGGCLAGAFFSGFSQSVGKAPEITGEDRTAREKKNSWRTESGTKCEINFYES